MFNPFTVIRALVGFGMPFLFAPVLGLLGLGNRYYNRLALVFIAGSWVFTISVILNLYRFGFMGLDKYPLLAWFITLFGYWALTNLLRWGCFINYDIQKSRNDESYRSFLRRAVRKYVFTADIAFYAVAAAAGVSYGIAKSDLAFLLLRLSLPLSALAVLAVYLFDRTTSETITANFTNPAAEAIAKKPDRRVIALVFVLLLSVATLLEIPNGSWFVWGGIAFYLIVVFLVHLRYARALYKTTEKHAYI